MNLQLLKSEIDTDPLARGYAGMTDQQVADSLNTVDRERNKASVSGDEIFNAADSTEYNALTASEQQLFLAICGRDFIDPFGANNVGAMVALFGGGSATITALQALRKEPASRAQELGLGKPIAGDVLAARNL